MAFSIPATVTIGGRSVLNTNPFSRLQQKSSSSFAPIKVATHMSMNQGDNNLNSLDSGKLNSGYVTPIEGTRTPSELIKMSAASSNNNYDNIPNGKAGQSSQGDFKTFDSKSYVDNGGQVNLSMIQQQAKLQELYKQGLSEEAAANFLAKQEDVEEACNIEEEKPTVYAWFVLFIIFAIRAIHQLHRQVIGFAFGY